MINLPLLGNQSFATLKTRQHIFTYLMNEFPDLMLIKESIISSLQKKPLGNFVTIKTSPWYYKDSIVLVGDAAHAVIPFYGQGMCAALEDCLSLVLLLGKHRNYQKAFSAYQLLRKRNTDILADLSIGNFIELRDRSRSEKYLLKDQIYTVLNRLFPSFCQPPLYVLVAHTTLTYSEAVALFNRQERVARFLGIDILLYSLMILKKIFKIGEQLIERLRRNLNTLQSADYYPIR